MEKSTLLHFSPILYWLLQQNLVGTLLGLRGTMSVNWTSNDLYFGKWQPFSGSETRFFALFSNSILVIPAKLRRDIARGKGDLVCKFDLGKWRPFFRVWSCSFSLCLNFILLIPTKLGRDIARGKEHLVQTTLSSGNGGHFNCLKSHFLHLSRNMTSKYLDLEKLQPF